MSVGGGGQLEPDAVSTGLAASREGTACSRSAQADRLQIKRRICGLVRERHPAKNKWRSMKHREREFERRRGEAMFPGLTGRYRRRHFQQACATMACEKSNQRSAERRKRRRIAAQATVIEPLEWYKGFRQFKPARPGGNQLE